MVLLAIPYHKSKRYCSTELLDWLEQADLKDCEPVIRVHTGVYGETDAVKRQREFFRRLAIERGASHLLFIGADTIPPLDVVPRLLAHKQDVVGGIYYGRNQATNGNKDHAVAWIHGNIEATSRANLEGKTELIKVDGMGMDCVLFTNNAFEKVSFLDWAQNDDDYPYYDRLKEKGYDIWLDPSVVCKHYSDNNVYS